MQAVTPGRQAAPANAALGTAAPSPVVTSSSSGPIIHPSSPYPDPIPGILPFGSISLLSGASGVGKTALISEWCRRWRDGRSICWHPTTVPAGIGVIVGDRKWSDHRQWFEAVGFPDIPHYSLRDDTGFNWDRLHNRQDLPKLLGMAIDRLKLPPGSLIVVDPISLFLPGNLNDYKNIAVGMGKLDTILSHRKVTVVGIVHMAKQKSDKKDRYTRAQDRILGSTALLGFSDTPMYFLGPEDCDDEYYGFGWIPHHAPSETFQFVRDENGLFIPYAAPDKASELALTLSMITSASGGMRTKEIIDSVCSQLGITSRSVSRYLQELESSGKIKRISRGIWRRMDV